MKHEFFANKLENGVGMSKEEACNLHVMFGSLVAVSMNIFCMPLIPFYCLLHAEKFHKQHNTNQCICTNIRFNTVRQPEKMYCESISESFSVCQFTKCLCQFNESFKPQIPNANFIVFRSFGLEVKDQKNIEKDQ